MRVSRLQTALSNAEKAFLSNLLERSAREGVGAQPQSQGVVRAPGNLTRVLAAAARSLQAPRRYCDFNSR